MDKKEDVEPCFSIATVEREVGISKDVLRVWERRYGFPSPVRDGRGERAYPEGQVRQLGLVKRLMDRGHRPGRLLGLTRTELEALAATAIAAATDAAAPAPAGLGPLLDRVRAHDADGLAERLQRTLALSGLKRFVLDIAAPLAGQVGEHWARGELRIHEEHLCTEAITRVLRQAISQLPQGGSPLVLLTTLPDEPHALGLLMAESVLVLHGARCVNLGTQMPVREIALAAQSHQADVVALSFSAAFPARAAVPALEQLRGLLAPEVRLWAGGAGAGRLSRAGGVEVLGSLEAAAQAASSASASASSPR